MARPSLASTVAFALALTLTFISRTASAQEPAFEALGQAPVVGGDHVRARERALEEAFRQAVEQAVATVLDPQAIVQRTSDLKLRIYPRARTFVSNYRVLEEGEVSGLFQVRISAQVSTARLARELTQPQSGMSGLPRLSAKPRAIVCVHADAPEVPEAGEKALRELLATRNVEALPPPPSCTEDAAAEAAKIGGAQAAVVGIVALQPAGPIRGTDRVAAEAKAKLKLVDPQGRTSAEGSGERQAYDVTVDRAGQLAARDALSDAARAIAPQLAQKWAPAAPAGGVSVQLSGFGRYADYQAIVRALQALPGVAGVEPRRFQRGQAELVVRTQSGAGQLAAGLSRVPPAGVRVQVRPDGDGRLSIQIAGPTELPERG